MGKRKPDPSKPAPQSCHPEISGRPQFSIFDMLMDNLDAVPRKLKPWELCVIQDLQPAFSRIEARIWQARPVVIVGGMDPSFFRDMREALEISVFDTVLRVLDTKRPDPTE